MREVQNPGQVISHLVYEQTTNNVQMKASQHMPSREGEDPCTLNEWVSTVKLLIENYIEQLKSRGHETRKQQLEKKKKTLGVGQLSGNSTTNMSWYLQIKLATT